MANEIRHSSATKPRIYPWNNATVPMDIDRLQTFGGAVNQPTKKEYEIGRLDKMAVLLQILESSVTMKQFEYGTMDFYLALANKTALPSGGLQLSDFNDSKFDIVSVGKDKFGGTLEQTIWIPKLALNSIQFNIPTADAEIERNFDMGGDFFYRLRYDNKYFIYKEITVPTGYSSAPYSVVLNDPAPVQNPVNSRYIERVLRIRSGVTTELVLTTDYTWTNGTTTLAILSATTGDEYKVVFTSDTWGTAGDPTSLNDSDAYFLSGDMVTVTLQSGTGTEIELDRLTSLNINATLNRIQEAVIGRKEKLIKEVKDYDVKVSLNGRVKDSSIEEVLMGQAGADYGVIDPNAFKTDITLRVKVYDSYLKTNFLIGYKVTNMAFTDTKEDANANDFWTNGINLDSDNMLISDVEGDIDA